MWLQGPGALLYETSHETDDTMTETGLSMTVHVLVFASISPLYCTVPCEHKSSPIIKQASLGNSELLNILEWSVVTHYSLDTVHQTQDRTFVMLDFWKYICSISSLETGVEAVLNVRKRAAKLWPNWIVCLVKMNMWENFSVHEDWLVLI